MPARHVKRKVVDERPTREMHKEELLTLLTADERAAARRLRARTTVQPFATLEPKVEAEAPPLPPMPEVEHTPLPATAPVASAPEADATSSIGEESFSIDTRELDARVFQKHALSLHKSGGVRMLAVGSEVIPRIPAPVEAAPPPSAQAGDEATELVQPLVLPPPSRNLLVVVLIALVIAAVAAVAILL